MPNHNISPWLWTALMPHPPVLVPDVGRGMENGALETLNGLAALTAAVRDQKPDVLLVLSPHLSYTPGALRINSSAHPRGSFVLYGAGNVNFELETALDAVDSLSVYLEGQGLHVRMTPTPEISADQGSMVPLYFLRREWGSLPPVILASPIGLEPHSAYTLGQVLSSYGKGQSHTWALLASGDLSHRLTPNAPAGYDPEPAHAFDAAIDRALETVDAQKLLGLSTETIDRAGECGLRSVLAMIGLVSGLEPQSELNRIKIFSHEGPFGVGYCTALTRFSGLEVSYE